jgi:hypothetical protein
MVMANKTVWVLVECIHQFVTTYCVECPVDFPEYALDTVVSGGAKEFSQRFIGENILSYQENSLDQAIAQCDIDNEYYKQATIEQKVQAFFTKEIEIE